MEVFLSDNARRYICRIGFVVCCALPTLLCLKVALFPKTVDQWSIQLRDQLGVISTIGAVDTLTPYRTDFRELAFGIGRFDSRLTIDQASLQSLDEGCFFDFSHASGSVQAFWESIQAMAQNIKWVSKDERPIVLHFRNLTLLESIAKASRSTVWQDVQVEINQRGRLVSVEFTPERSTQNLESEDQQAILKCTLDSKQQTWSLNAMGHELPMWVLQPIVFPTRAFDEDTVLQNAVASLVYRDAKWSGEMKGSLKNTDLTHLVGRNFDASISGKAVIHVDQLRILNNRIEYLKGDLHSPEGTIGSTLLQACQNVFGMRQMASFGNKPIESYSDLRFGFQLERDKIALFGMKSGAVLNDVEGNTALIAQHGRAWPNTAIIQLFGWPAYRVNPRVTGLARHLVISPLVEVEQPKKPRTARSGEVGEQPFFNR